MEGQISLEKEEKSLFRNLMERLLEGFENPQLGATAKELHMISLERAEIKVESERMKNKIMEDEERVDDSRNWKELVNELRYNLEEKSAKESSLNSQHEETLAKLDKMLREEKRKSQKVRDLEAEMAELKI